MSAHIVDVKPDVVSRRAATRRASVNAAIDFLKGKQGKKQSYAFQEPGKHCTLRFSRPNLKRATFYSLHDVC